MVWLVVGLIVSMAAVAAGSFALGYWYARRNLPRILVRPHTAATAARMPLPEQSAATVVEAAFVRANRAGSTSTME